MYDYFYSNCFSRTFFTFLLLLLLFGCKENQKQTADKMLIFKKEKAIDFSDSDFFRNKTVIPLETGEQALIHHSPCVKKDGENLFIYIRDEHYPILRFDMKGNFLNRIGSRGQGPNEFTNMYDVFINKEKSIVELLTNNKIIYFSYDGIPIKSKNSEMQQALSFSFLNGYYWFYLGSDNSSTYRLLQTDEHFNLKNQYLSDKTNMFPMYEYYFYQSPYNTFREMFYYDLYSIKSDSLFMSYTIKFPNMELSSKIHKMPPIEAFKYLEKSHYAFINRYLENDDYVYLFVIESKDGEVMTFYHWIVNKNNNYQEKIIKIDRADYIMESYLRSPQLLTDDNCLYFLGYPIESESDNAITDFDLNPSIIIVNLPEAFL
jgi:hypothetical protein